MKTKLLITTILLMFSYAFAQETGKPSKAPINPPVAPAKASKAVVIEQKVEAKGKSENENNDMTPGELSKKVLSAASDIKSTKIFEEKLAKLAALEKLVEVDADKTTVEGIRYSVSLEPMLKQRKNLKDKTVCWNVRNETEYLFTSGSGFRGKLHYFAQDSLQLLAAMCDIPDLSKFEN